MLLNAPNGSFLPIFPQADTQIFYVSMQKFGDNMYFLPVWLASHPPPSVANSRKSAQDDGAFTRKACDVN